MVISTTHRSTAKSRSAKFAERGAGPVSRTSFSNWDLFYLVAFALPSGQLHAPRIAGSTGSIGGWLRTWEAALGVTEAQDLPNGSSTPKGRPVLPLPEPTRWATSRQSDTWRLRAPLFDGALADLGGIRWPSRSLLRTHAGRPSGHSLPTAPVRACRSGRRSCR
jgi:hypothetical protein